MPLIKQFLPFAQERIGFKRPPRLFLRGDTKNAENPLGKTAFYDPAAKSITLYITNRHPKDIMRSLSHELVHHKQNCNGKFRNVGEMGEGYAQNDVHLREMEREAYESGNMCFRDWEDSIKSTIYFESLQKEKGVKEQMSTKDWKNRELNSLLMERFGFKFNALDEEEEEELEEGEYYKRDDDEDIEEAATGSRLGGSRAKQQCEKDKSKRFVAGKCVNRDEVEENLAGGASGAIMGGRDDDDDDPEEVEEGFVDAKAEPRPRGPKTSKKCYNAAGDAVPCGSAEAVKEGDEDLEERHKPDNIAQGRDSARSTKKIATGQKLREDIAIILRKYMR